MSSMISCYSHGRYVSRDGFSVRSNPFIVFVLCGIVTFKEHNVGSELQLRHTCFCYDWHKKFYSESLNDSTAS